MLKGLDPILDADTLHTLRAMGHGDMLILADTNFPADALSRATVRGRLLRIEQPLARVARAVLSVLPLDDFVADFAARMQVVDDPDTVPEVQAEVQAAIAATGETRDMVGVERFAFYELARQAYAVIQTGERRFYGCVMLRKGVVGPDE
ncbi:RbsD/FucU family protein [Jannaschia ovalis]|uniref:RbsD/FucU domain-containing protein n=1 Tax=Jannaschia ovalis TaxID=3038773 RepID=A0ABY8LHJ3_9RHOB|nr:RbsD/FucU domain-containing protein [Jannaschia sp. GRR-S6-38]WGH79664.1 RbsD/FucU domain-containing protein [Jannaschia sp. GRR-S6-38]